MTKPMTGYRSTPRARSGGCLRVFLVVAVVVVVLAVALDFVARFVAQNVAASEIHKHGFPARPSVKIEGFPFLTQVASRDFHQVDISSGSFREGPLRVSRFSAVATGVHVTGGFTAGRISQVRGSVIITFPALATALQTQIGPLGSLVGGSGLKLSSAGRHEVRASVSLVLVSGSAVWRISRGNGQQFRIHLVSSHGLPVSLLGSIRDFSVNVPHLPFGLKIRTVDVTPQGIVGKVAGRNLSFGS